MKRAVAAVVCALTALHPLRAEAHQDSITHLRVSAEGRAVSLELQIEAVDLNEAMGAPASRELSRAEARAGASRVAAYATSRLIVRDARSPCEPVSHTARVLDRRDTWDLVVRLAYECPHAVDALTLRYGLFFDVDPRHQGMTTVALGGRSVQHVFRDDARDVTVDARPARARQLLTYARLGVDHIFLGYDHIAFLVSLLLAVGHRARRESARAVLAIVTSFTAAHSATLIAAALGLVRASPVLVEPAIAASIAFVAIENLLPREPAHRPALAFAFGLVHGFGFAGVLAEQGLPARGVVPSLLAFNVGVELGQLTLVWCMLPALWLLAASRWTAGAVGLAVAGGAGAWGLLGAAGVGRGPLAGWLLATGLALCLSARRWGYPLGVRRAASVILALLGAFWFVERVSGKVLLGGALG